MAFWSMARSLTRASIEGATGRIGDVMSNLGFGATVRALAKARGDIVAGANQIRSNWRELSARAADKSANEWVLRNTRRAAGMTDAAERAAFLNKLEQVNPDLAAEVARMVTNPAAAEAAVAVAREAANEAAAGVIGGVRQVFSPVGNVLRSTFLPDRSELRPWTNWARRMAVLGGGSFAFGSGYRLITGTGGPFVDQRGRFDIAGLPFV